MMTEGRRSRPRGTSGRSYKGSGGITKTPNKKKGRKESSRRWIQRQLNDPFVAEAKLRGFRSRSALKLEQIDRKYGVLKRGMAVLDLGCAPGGWLQYAALKIGLNEGGGGDNLGGGGSSVGGGKLGGGSESGGKLVGVDVLDVEPVAGAVILKGDINDDEILAALIRHLNGAADSSGATDSSGPADSDGVADSSGATDSGGAADSGGTADSGGAADSGGVADFDGVADVVLSDMAADTTGHRPTDHLRTTALLDVALDTARRVLKPGGVFLAKCFRGGAERAALDAMKRDFASVRHVKPTASRQESVEIYVLATGYRGRPTDDAE